MACVVVVAENAVDVVDTSRLLEDFCASQPHTGCCGLAPGTYSSHS